MMLATIIHSSYKHGNTNQVWRFCHDGSVERNLPKIFYHHLNLEQRVPRTHLLRRIQKQIDFDFIYEEVRGTYGDNGNVSIPPPVIKIETHPIFEKSNYNLLYQRIAGHP